MRLEKAIDKSIKKFLDGKLDLSVFKDIEDEEFIFTPEYFDELEREFVGTVKDADDR